VRAMSVASLRQKPDDILGLCEELHHARETWLKYKRENTRLEGVLAKRLEDLDVARDDILYLREVAVAFAFVAVSADPTLRSARTLELLREECNRCRAPSAVELKPGFRT
jgi:uncharacterized protein YjiS (DUF1127 family)